MISNLRSKSIQGHITDSAGNILRNATIVIKVNTPTSVNVVDSAISDDDGYFISKPLPNGIYDIYESGIRVSQVIHTADRNSIQVFKADSDNYNTTIIESFSDLIENDATKQLNKFKMFLQIEPNSIDVAQYGNIFPLYDVDLTQLEKANESYYDLSQFFGFESESRITITRFDIEYYSPLTSISQSYKRIRWSGVPGIRNSSDSKLVLPLDYFSIVANLSKVVQPVSNTAFTAGTIVYEYVAVSGTLFISQAGLGDSDYAAGFYPYVNIGDIVKVELDIGDWYGLVVSKTDGSGSLKKIELKNWLTSRSEYTSVALSPLTGDVEKISAYNGMFQAIPNIDEETNELFTVVENVSAQNGADELYTYINAPIS